MAQEIDSHTEALIVDSLRNVCRLFNGLKANMGNNAAAWASAMTALDILLPDNIICCNGDIIARDQRDMLARDIQKSGK